MDLIPGLPYDVALHCLLRLSFNQFPSIQSVCKAWKLQIKLPEFLQLRRCTGKAQPLVVLAQARVDLDLNQNQKTSKSNLYAPAYRLVVFEPETGCWSEMPPLPEFSSDLPMFCKIAAVGMDLVVIGGYDPLTWEALDSVFVFDFMSATWRRGKNVPDGPRSFFGCASDGDRTVYIAGGHDGEKNALRSAWSYDVATDTWVPLPDMAKERDECQGLFHRGKFHVIGGYPTDRQGYFDQSGEFLDAATWKPFDVFSDGVKCRINWVEGDDRKLYTCQGGDVLALEGATWERVIRMPSDVTNAGNLTGWQGKLMVIGNWKYVLDLKKLRWSKVEVPVEYSGHVQSGGCLII